MADDATRRLLRMFGIAVTDCEDALAVLQAALGDAPPAPGGAAAAVAAYGKAAQELAGRWAEVSGLLQDYQARAQTAIEAHLRARDAGG